MKLSCEAAYIKPCIRFRAGILRTCSLKRKAYGSARFCNTNDFCCKTWNCIWGEMIKNAASGNKILAGIGDPA